MQENKYTMNFIKTMRTHFFVDDDLKIQNTNYKGIPIISFKNLSDIRKIFKLKGFI